MVAPQCTSLFPRITAAIIGNSLTSVCEKKKVQLNPKHKSSHPTDFVAVNNFAARSALSTLAIIGNCLKCAQKLAGERQHARPELNRHPVAVRCRRDPAEPSAVSGGVLQVDTSPPRDAQRVLALGELKEVFAQRLGKDNKLFNFSAHFVPERGRRTGRARQF
jgi:hypothetical protein